LRRRPLVAEDDWNLSDAELARGLEPEVAIYDLAVAPNQAGHLESKFLDRRAHAIHSGVVLAGIPNVGYELIDRPRLSLRCRHLQDTRPPVPPLLSSPEYQFGNSVVNRKLASDALYRSVEEIVGCLVGLYVGENEHTRHRPA